MNFPQQDFDFSQPMLLEGMRVLPEHIDANGHMNVGYYNVIFDLALDKFFVPFDLDWSYVQRTNLSTFVLETHVCYLQEVVQNDPLRFTFQLLDYDAKRLHYFMGMYHAEKNYLAATSEQALLHVSLETRRASPFLEEHQVLFARMLAGHGKLPRPEQAGRSIGLAKKPKA
ncbi:thioesterase family protein [Ferrovibrio sp.]|uniref:thioesterase family protein n=1 Tax=Ferrovibrio sp. TaxID=1917215 RepID=UPI0025C4AB67|nr:thioesterase family protein [Ferrovibrio sp.]MBX3455004.1 thioesterase family protein [Ferrovibrio sp.]